MSLPEILLPAGVAPFRAAGHAFRRGGVHVDVPRGTGHVRKRPRRTAASHLITVSTRISKDAAPAFESWYENTLRAGTLAFAAYVFGLETSAPVWWSATWESPPKLDALSGGFWTVSGQLRVTGEAGVTGPVSTSASVEFAASLDGTAMPVISSNAQVEFSVSLDTAALASVEFSAALLVYEPSFELREDGGFELREDGGQEERD